MKLRRLATDRLTMKKTTAVALATLCLASLAAAEVTEGVLEKGAAYSALFSASPDEVRSSTAVTIAPSIWAARAFSAAGFRSAWTS